ncbi:MAG: class I SAM-dependent methyltransferase [Coriobacteriia bacterium]|nr:class I SAM-dependent methyltransferase [Coriobacteriia bacterium]
MSNSRNMGPVDVRPEDYSHLSERGQALVDRFRSRVVDFADSDSPKRLLEVGCGQGWLLSELQRALPQASISGIDIREEAIEYARTLAPQADLRVADAVALPFGDSDYDLVVCSEVLEHVADPARVIDEIKRVGSGHAVFSVPYEPWFWAANLARGKYFKSLGNCPGHIHHFTRGRFERLLARHYTDVEVVSSFPWLIADVRW